MLFPCCHYSQIVGIFYCWVESSLPVASMYDFLILGSLWYSSFFHECLLYTFWFFAAPVGTWEGHLCSSFLVFRGTFLELSQSYSSCPALPEDPGRLAASGYPGPLATSGYPGPVLSLNFARLFNDLFAGNLNINRALMLILLAAWIGPSLLFMEWAFLWILAFNNR